MVAPLLCSSLLGGLPVFTVVAFFAATVFKNAHIGQLESEPAAPPAFHFKWPTLQDGAPFLLFLALLTCDLILRVLHDRQMALLTKEREEALEDARQCRADAAPLEAPDTYAQAAKMQRRAIMREKHAAQLDSLKEKHSNNGMYKVLRFCHTGAWTAFVLWSWGLPAATVPPRLLWPLEDALSLAPQRLSGGVAGAISGPAWAWVCMAASSRVAGLVERYIPSPGLGF